MATWIEDENCFAVEVHRNLHLKSLFEGELGWGIVASFGEPRSKFGSGWDQLIKLAFDKATSDFDSAVDW
jgi:hypothetical protein